MYLKSILFLVMTKSQSLLKFAFQKKYLIFQVSEIIFVPSFLVNLPQHLP